MYNIIEYLKKLMKEYDFIFILMLNSLETHSIQDALLSGPTEMHLCLSSEPSCLVKKQPYSEVRLAQQTCSRKNGNHSAVR